MMQENMIRCALDARKHNKGMCLMQENKVRCLLDARKHDKAHAGSKKT
jgi:hypothetical protein